MLDYRYETGERRFKHKWKQKTAGFERSGTGYVGKCPSDVTHEIAEERLNAGIPVYDSEESVWPSKIYTIFRGVVYEAVPTNPGRSYHAYPWRGDLPGRRPLVRWVRKRLRDLAIEWNELSEYKEWMKKYGG